jgi:PKD repeat protein
MLTTWMLNQPEILGQSSSNQAPIAAISDVGQTIAGRSISLDARATYDPIGNALTYAWDFGDGIQASGIAVTHTYTSTGTYDLKLTVSSKSGTRTLTKVINVVTHPTSYNNPFARFPQNGVPPANPAVTLPIPNDQLSDKVTTTAAAIAIATTSKPLATTKSAVINTTRSYTGWLVGALILAVLLTGGIVVVLRRKNNPPFHLNDRV